MPGASPRRDMLWGHASPEAKPEPEDVLIAWLLWLPREADVAKAAADEVARMDKRLSLSGAAACLRELLLQLVDGRPLTQYGTA